jgi:cysteine desulfurase
MNPVYLDYNATTPVLPEVLDAMLPYYREHFGNPSSSHLYGRRALQGVEDARVRAAVLMGCSPDEIVFTSGGSESNNHAIRGSARARVKEGNHIITSAVEHPAVSEVCRDLEKEGFRITFVPVDGLGMVDMDALRRSISEETILITIMHANNEVGTIQPIGEISEVVRDRGIIFHTDAAQSAGKIPVNVDDLGVDLLSIAGHKIYAPKGVGLLYIRRGTSLHKLMQGAGHEAGRRAGTENVAQIAGLGMACEIAYRDMEKNREHVRTMRDRLHGGLSDLSGDIRLNGDPVLRLPNTLNLSFPGIRAQDLLASIGEVAVASAGAACHGDSVTISHVLEAMGITEERASGAVRFSTGKLTTAEEVDLVVLAVREALICL